MGQSGGRVKDRVRHWGRGGGVDVATDLGVEVGIDGVDVGANLARVGRVEVKGSLKEWCGRQGQCWGRWGGR